MKVMLTIRVLLALLLTLLALAALGTWRLPMSHATALPQPDHDVVVIEENRSYEAIIGSAQAPYINALASQGAVLTNSYASEHPSQPNYTDLFSGSNRGVTDNSCPVTFRTPNLGSALIGAGLSVASYAEDLPSVGSTTCSSGNYLRVLNPSVGFTNVPATDNQPFTNFPTDFTTLPTVSFVVPNLLDDMHENSSSIQAGDTWLQQHIDPYVQWAKTRNSLLIIQWDEDEDIGGPNHIPTIFYGPMVAPYSMDRWWHQDRLPSMQMRL